MNRMSSKQHEQRPHAILLAFPLQGHVFPAVHLALKLASRGFVITFVNTDSFHHQTSKASSSSTGDSHDIFAAVRGSGLDIRYTTVSDGLPVEHDRSLNVDQSLASLMHLMSGHVEELVAKLVKQSVPPVTCFIADTFFVWPSAIAKKFGLLSVSFWTEPALVFTLYYHMDLLRNHGHFDSHEVRNDPIDYIPGVDRIDLKDTASYLQERDTSTLFHQMIFAAFNDVKDADFVLCNTVQELEPYTIAALKDKKPFYAIGPLLPDEFSKGTLAPTLWTQSHCTHWLDSKSRGSVLYASFGSLCHVTKRDIVEIAHGLLLSNVSFVLVVRPDLVDFDVADPLPVGFREEVCDRAMIVPWCCQTQVLSHPAVKAFLTHCGWNSILEGIWSEVPFLCFPLLTDQFTNRKLVVDDWKVGINLSDRMEVTREEVAENIRRLMDGKSGEQFKTKIRDIKKKLKEAWTNNGSSGLNMECFIKDLNAKSHI